MNLNTKEINNKPPLVNYPDPEDVYSLFKQINRVPRPSWHEEKIVIFLQQFAATHSLECVATDSSCVVIKKRATQGYENAPIIVLLNHIDMVCVAEEGKKFDPLNDPIESYTDNGWIKANGTSLGADNGIGMAMALAILQSRNIIHGPLECIFTANEEDGMTGAATLSPDFLSGRLIINLDSEDYDTITIGSAAAYLQFTTLHVTREKGEPDYCYLKLNIKGGNGGHSGVDINKGRANANKLIGEFIYQQSKKHDVKLLAFNGGEANNSIPVNAEVTVGIPTLYKDQFSSDLELFAKENKKIYKDTDSKISFIISETVAPESVISKKETEAFLKSIHECPFGTLKMSDTINDAVETSNNLGVIKTNEVSIFISNYSRSFIDAEVIKLGNRIKNIFDEAGAETEVIMSAPGWKSNLSSLLLKQAEKSFCNTLGFMPKKVAMHFALESGYFIQKYPGCEIVSIGPKIIEPHSITERVKINTIDNIWKVLINMLHELAH